MKSAMIYEFGPVEDIRVEEKQLIGPGMDEALIKIEASSVGFTDTLIRKGIYPLLKKKPPFTLGYDYVGRIESVAENNYGVKPGQRVTNLVMTGGNAEYIVDQVKNLITIPDDIPAPVAASFSVSGITAWQMFHRVAQVKPGQRILIHGASGAVGNFLLQLGKLFQCEMVATASKKNHAFIMHFTASALDYQQKDYWQQLQKAGKEGFDAVFDFTNQRSFNTSFKLLKPGGILVTYAVYSSALSIRKKNFLKFLKFGIDFGKLMLKIKYWSAFTNQHAAFYGIMDSKKAQPVNYKEDFEKLCQWYREDKIKPELTIFPLTKIKEAHELLSRRMNRGQIVIVNTE